MSNKENVQPKQNPKQQEVKETQQEMLNQVEHLSEYTSTANVKPNYKHTDNAGILYKRIITSLNRYSKGEILLKEDIIALIRHEYETI